MKKGEGLWIALWRFYLFVFEWRLKRSNVLLNRQFPLRREGRNWFRKMKILNSYHDWVLSRTEFRKSEWLVNKTKIESKFLFLSSSKISLPTSNNFLAWQTCVGKPVISTDVRRPDWLLTVVGNWIVVWVYCSIELIHISFICWRVWR